MIDPLHIDLKKLREAIHNEHEKYKAAQAASRFVYHDMVRRTDLYRLCAHTRGKIHATKWDKVGTPWRKEMKEYKGKDGKTHTQPKYTNEITYRHFVRTLEEQEKYIPKELIQEFWLETARRPFIKATKLQEEEVRPVQEVRVVAR